MGTRARRSELRRHGGLSPHRPVLAAVRAVTGWLVTLAVVVLLLPTQFGGQTGYVIVSGTSMEPTYETGDLLVTRQTDRYEVGDVITYRIPVDRIGAGASVVHRVVGGDQHSGLITQGDNTRHLDPWRPTEQDVIGGEVLHIPGAGWLLAWFAQPVIAGAWMAAMTVAVYATSDRQSKSRSATCRIAPITQPDRPSTRALRHHPAAVDGDRHAGDVGRRG